MNNLLARYTDLQTDLKAQLHHVETVIRVLKNIDYYNQQYGYWWLHLQSINAMGVSTYNTPANGRNYHYTTVSANFENTKEHIELAIIRLDDLGIVYDNTAALSQVKSDAEKIAVELGYIAKDTE